MKVNLVVVGSNEVPAKVQRPDHSVLENRGLKRSGLNSLGSWEEGLESYLASSKRTYQARVTG